MVVYACNHNTQDVEAGGPVQVSTPLHIKFETSLGYLRPCMVKTSHPNSQQTMRNSLFLSQECEREHWKMITADKTEP